MSDAGGELSTAGLRLLSSTAPVHEKLHGALQLAYTLLPAQAAAQLQASVADVSSAEPQQVTQPKADTQGHGTPPSTFQALHQAVHAHYLQAVCDWAVSSLTRSANSGNSTTLAAGSNHHAEAKGKQRKEQGKKRTASATDQQLGAVAADSASAPACVDTRMWLLVTALLAAGAQPPPPSIVTAAAAACRLAAGWSSTCTPLRVHQLLRAVFQVLQQSRASHGTRHAGSARDWQPPLESLGALLTALMACRTGAAATAASECHADDGKTHHSVASDAWPATWADLTHLTLQEMLTSAQGTQNPRKALAAVLSTPVFHALLRLAFPIPASSLVLTRLLQPAADLTPPTNSPVNATHTAAQPAPLEGAMHSAHSLTGTMAVRSMPQLPPAHVQATARGVLEASLLHEAHVGGLAEACQQLAQPVLSNPQHKAPAGSALPADQHISGGSTEQKDVGVASMQGGEDQKGEGAGEEGSGAGLDSPLARVRSYHAAIFQALLGAAQAHGDMGLRGAACACMAWLLGAAGSAFSRLRRTHTESAGALRVALRGGPSGRRGADEAAPIPAPGPAEGPLQHAEFHLLVALVGLVLPLAHAQAGEKGGKKQGHADAVAGQPDRKRRLKAGSQGARCEGAGCEGAPTQAVEPGLPVDAMYGLAALLNAAKVSRVYEPTQDVTQLHRAFLTRLTTSILDASYHRRASVPPPSALVTTEKPADGGMMRFAAAVCSAICSMLALEYRALTASLPALWALLEDTVTVTRGTNSCEPVLLAVAAACTGQLMVAYAELRQLHVLLESLADALVAAGAGGQAAGVHIGRLAHVLLQPQVLQSLAAAVTNLPPGQGAPLLSGLSAHLQRLHSPTHAAGAAHSPQCAQAGHLAAAALVVTCTQAVRLELPTAGPIAAACQQLVSHLAEPMVTLLALACKKPKAGKRSVRHLLRSHDVTLLTMQLQIYCAAVSLHARCVALNPEVPVLPGQAAGSPGAGAAEAAAGDGQGDPAGGPAQRPGTCQGFFAAALHAAGPSAAELLLKATGKAGGRLCRAQQRRQAAEAAAGAAEAASAVAQGGEGEDTTVNLQADPLLVLAVRQYLPALDSAATGTQPHDAVQLAAVQHTDAVHSGDSSQWQVSSVHADQCALAHTVHGCLLQQASVLHDRVLLLQSACTRVGSRLAADSCLAHARIELGLSMHMLLPTSVFFNESEHQGEVDSEAEEVVDSDGVKGAAGAGRAEHFQLLLTWLQCPAPQAGTSMSLLVAGLHLSQAGASGLAACAEPQDWLQSQGLMVGRARGMGAAVGGLPGMAGDASRQVHSIVEAVRGELLGAVWTGAQQAVSCWGPGPWLPPTLTRAVLRLQMASHARVQALNQPLSNSHSSDSTSPQQPVLLHQVAASSCNVLHGLVGWQALAHVSGELLPAYCEVGRSLLDVLVLRTQAVMSQVGAPTGAMGEGVGRLQAAMRLMQESRAAAAGKKVTKAMKLFVTQVTTDAASASASAAASSAELRHVADHGTHRADAPGITAVGLAVSAARQLGSHMSRGPPVSALPQLTDHVIVCAAVLVQLLADCWEARDPVEVAEVVDGAGGRGRGALSSLCGELCRAAHEALLTLGACQSALHRVRQAQAAGRRQEEGEGTLQLPWKKLLAWLQCVSTFLTHCQHDTLLATDTDAVADGGHDQNSFHASAAHVDLTSLHAAVAWVMQCSMALQLQHERASAAGVAMQGAGGVVKTSHGVADDVCRSTGSAVFKQMVDMADGMLAGACSAAGWSSQSGEADKHLAAGAERSAGDQKVKKRRRLAAQAGEAIGDMAKQGAGGGSALTGTWQAAEVMAGVQQCAALLSAACQHVVGLSAGEGMPAGPEAGGSGAAASTRRRRRAGVAAAAAAVQQVAAQLSEMERQLRWLISAAAQQASLHESHQQQQQEAGRGQRTGLQLGVSFQVAHQLLDSCCVAYAALAQLSALAGPHPADMTAHQRSVESLKGNAASACVVAGSTAINTKATGKRKHAAGTACDTIAGQPRRDHVAIISAEGARQVLLLVLSRASQQPAPALPWPQTEQQQATAAALLTALSALAPELTTISADHLSPEEATALALLQHDGNSHNVLLQGASSLMPDRHTDGPMHEQQGPLPMHITLLEAHASLLVACCPPLVCGSPPAQAPHGARSALTFDLVPGSWPCAVRTQLLGSLRRLVGACGAARFRSMLLHVERQVQAALAPLHGGRLPAALPAYLHCLLVLLEVEGSPSMAKVLTAAAHDLIATLSLLLVTLGGLPSLPSVDPARPAEAACSDNVPGQLAGAHTDTATYAAAAYIAVRALESLAGRPLTFQMSDCQVSSIMSSAAALCPAHTAAAGGAGVGQQAGLEWCGARQAALVACCSLLTSCLRHRPAASRGCAPLIVDALRGMLAHVVAWADAHHAQQQQQQGEWQWRHAGAGGGRMGLDMGDAVAHCANAIARVYESLVQDKEHASGLRMYCMHAVADYITLVAMAVPTAQALEDLERQEVMQPGQGALLPPVAALALRRGTRQLLGVLGPMELQALHVALGPGWGGARRGVLAALRKDWEKNVKFSGKV